MLPPEIAAVLCYCSVSAVLAASFSSSLWVAYLVLFSSFPSKWLLAGRAVIDVILAVNGC